jgi:hypothetical protein
LPNYLPLFPLITEDYIIIGDTGWYDYSFGPTGYTKSFYDKMKFSSWTWPDKRFCNWIGMTNEEVSEHFLQILENQLKQIEDKKIIVITHVVPHEDFIMKKEGHIIENGIIIMLFLEQKNYTSFIKSIM